jgi:hypothetical protein
MKISETQNTTIRVILLFSVAILSTFIGDNFHEFLGDWKCEGSGLPIKVGYGIYYSKCNYAQCGSHNPMWHWGYRHYLYLIMSIVVFIIQANDIFTNKSKQNEH